MAWIDLAKARYRFIQPALGDEGIAQIAQRLVIVWPDLDSPAIILDCFVKPAFRNEGVAQIVQRFGVVRIAPDGLAKAFHHRFNVSLAFKQQAQIIVGQGAVRVFGQRVAPESFHVRVRPGLLPGQHGSTGSTIAANP